MRRRALTFVIWVALGLAFLLAELGSPSTPEQAAARDTWWVITAVAIVLLDLAALYGALRLARRFPLGRGQPLRHLGPHVLLWLAFTMSGYAVDFAYETSHGLQPGTLLGRLFSDLILFAALDGIAHASEYFRRYRESETASLRLRVELAEVGRRRAEAELRALRAELNPQVMGDALDSVASLARTDPDRAEQTLVQLGETMRAAITPYPAGEPSADAVLEEEAAALEPFLALQRARFGSRLAVDVSIDESALDARVPHLLLHRTVAAAIDRAMARAGPSAVRLMGARIGDRVRLVENDDGVLADLPWREADADDRVTDPPAPAPRRSIAVPVILTLWFLLILATAFAGAMTVPMASGVRATVGIAIFQAFVTAITQVTMLYTAIRLARAARPLRAHVLAAAGFGFAISGLKVLFALVLGFPYVLPSVSRFVTGAVVGAVFYAFYAAAAAAVAYARRHRGSAATEVRLQAEIADAARRRAEAQLRALKAELNPHFLGNALAAAAALVRTDVDAAERVVGQLGRTLRAVVAQLDTQEVTLREELDALAPFLELERIRSRDRLEVAWDVDDDALEGRVPHLILQPLVENAVKHGLSGASGCVVVAARRVGERLELSVRDNGRGLKPLETKRPSGKGGVGLANVRSRLEELYGAGASVDLTPAPPPGTGTLARVSLPWRVT